MKLKTIDAALVKKAFLAGAVAIDAKKDIINELNVFPVPDGDTGTNMTMTIMSAAKEVSLLKDPDMETLAKAISSGSLRGARGNSGVILSQLLRGFTKVIKEYQELDVITLSNAFSKAVETAYKAVMKPKEGTILTVARGGSEKAAELVGDCDDVIEFAGKVVAYMSDVLDYTPELLPVLKEAGVVDSGGRGLLEVMKGAYDALCGKEIAFTLNDSIKPVEETAEEKRVVNTENISTADIKFGYCTEFIILLEKKFKDKDEIEFKAFLESIGDSIVCVADDDIVKIHVHTNDPGLALQKALGYGQLSRIKIDNMREEHNERLFKANEAEKAGASETKPEPIPHKDNGFIAVAAGSGLADIFKGLGVDFVIEGGQTMNPSTEDMLNAIEKVNADNIYILPNNKNIILAANQAASLVEDKNVVVVPSKTVPQGIASLISFSADRNTEENLEAMQDAMSLVKSGEVTYAVRDTRIDGMDISQGDFMGIDDKTIRAVGKELATTSLDLVSAMVDEESSLVSIYYGLDSSEEEAEALGSAIEELYPDLDIEIHAGAQPIYYYIMSVE